MNKIGVIIDHCVEEIIFNKDSSHEIKTSTHFAGVSPTLKFISASDNYELICLVRQPDVTLTAEDFLANLWALREYGATMVIAITAVTSINAAIKSGDIVVPHQLFDTTANSISYQKYQQLPKTTAVLLGQPFSEDLRQLVLSEMQATSNLHFDVVVMASSNQRSLTLHEAEVFRKVLAGDVADGKLCIEAQLAAELDLQFAAVGVVAAEGCKQLEINSIVKKQLQTVEAAIFNINQRIN